MHVMASVLGSCLISVLFPLIRLQYLTVSDEVRQSYPVEKDNSEIKQISIADYGSPPMALRIHQSRSDTVRDETEHRGWSGGWLNVAIISRLTRTKSIGLSGSTCNYLSVVQLP